MQLQYSLQASFAKDIIDDIFFLMIDKYPIEIFGFQYNSSFTQDDACCVNYTYGGVFILWFKKEQKQ